MSRECILKISRLHTIHIRALSRVVAYASERSARKFCNASTSAPPRTENQPAHGDIGGRLNNGLIIVSNVALIGEKEKERKMAFWKLTIAKINVGSCGVIDAAELVIMRADDGQRRAKQKGGFNAHPLDFTSVAGLGDNGYCTPRRRVPPTRSPIASLFFLLLRDVARLDWLYTPLRDNPQYRTSRHGCNAISGFELPLFEQFSTDRLFVCTRVSIAMAASIGARVCEVHCIWALTWSLIANYTSAINRHQSQYVSFNNANSEWNLRNSTGAWIYMEYLSSKSKGR